MSKEDQSLIVLDLETMTYETEATGKKMYGEGDFGDQPDQNYFGPTRKFMYFTEDGGGDPGVHARATSATSPIRTTSDPRGSSCSSPRTAGEIPACTRGTATTGRTSRCSRRSRAGGTT